jgi:hypothetical protein
MDVSGQLHAPAALPPEKEPLGTDWIGGWVGRRAVLDVMVQGTKVFSALFYSVAYLTGADKGF